MRYVEKFPEILPLSTIRENADRLGQFHLLQRGNRLSVMPVSDHQWDVLVSLAHKT